MLTVEDATCIWREADVHPTDESVTFLRLVLDRKLS